MWWLSWLSQVALLSRPTATRNNRLIPYSIHADPVSRENKSISGAVANSKSSSPQWLSHDKEIFHHDPEQ